MRTRPDGDQSVGRPHGRRLGRLVSPMVALALVAACQGPGPVGPGASLALAVDPALAAPSALDWSTQRLSSPAILAKRRANFRTLAFPAASSGWNVGATPGLPLTSYGCTAADILLAGPASTIVFDPSSGLYNKVFFLTREGKFLKVDRANPAIYTRWTAPAGKTFLRTFVTLSPGNSRAYLLASDGTVYVVNTGSMTTVATIALGGGGVGIAPWIDPLRSRHDDQSETIWVPNNAGLVKQVTITGAPDGSVSAVSAAISYNVATTATMLNGRRVMAPALVYGGVIYLGDQGGYLHVYDTNTASEVIYAVGGPVTTAPALEIQDGTYTLTDPSGTPKAVAAGDAVYAFVTAGANCAWVNVHDQTVTRSRPLYIDDNDAAKKFGYLLDYGYSTAGTTEYLAAQDGGNINTESPDRALPGYTPNNWTNDFLVPAETNTHENPLATAAGGPVASYIRWNSSSVYGAGSVINSATLRLTAAGDQGCRVPEIRNVSSLYRDGSAPWASNALTNANRPFLGAANVGVYLSGGISGAGNVSYKVNKPYLFDVTSAFATPAVDGRYALGLQYNAGGNVLWPEGPIGGAVGKKAKNATQVEAVKFYNNALNADPGAGVSTDDRPLLTLVVAAASLPGPAIDTPPVIDSATHVVYVMSGNTLFSLDFTSPEAFADTDVDTATGTQTPHTLFNLAYYGDSSINVAGVGGKKPGGLYNNRTKVVGNATAPVPDLTLSNLFVLSRTPTPDGAAPTTWSYALSKISLPLSATTNKMAASSPTVTGVPGRAVTTGLSTDQEASAYMVVDPYPGAGNIYFGLANGRIYQYDK